MSDNPRSAAVVPLVLRDCDVQSDWVQAQWLPVGHDGAGEVLVRVVEGGAQASVCLGMRSVVVLARWLVALPFVSVGEPEAQSEDESGDPHD